MSSTTIDEKVVSIQFDNRKFEQNVSTTMNTLDKLKAKFDFKGASKGFEDISRSAQKVNFNPMASAIESVGFKFNGLWTIADQTLRNITNSVEMTAKKMVSAFTIDPIKTGFQEYETQINAVQTILANTESKGTTLSDVNAALDELNAYADKTIYNFTEMTRNIGTFTAAGTDLETSVNAIQGIANLAAVSGSTSQQASTAMYQLSQALAAGTVKLMDWNSVVNAGMGGQVFQDALKETARVHGIAIDQMIEEEGSFRETLSEGWITSEILTETLSKFTMSTEGLTEAQIAQNRAMWKAKGYTDAQIDAIFKLGDTATNAATKVKTFTQLMDTLKEAAQSGWTQTWELLVGDFEEAKELWTEVSDEIGAIINASSESRNELLGGALKSNYEKLIEELATAGISADKFTGKVREMAIESGMTEEQIDALVKEYGSMEKAVKAGAFETNVLVRAVNSLKSSAIDLSGVAKDLSKGARGEDVKKIQHALKEAGFQCGEFGEALDGVDGKFGKVTKASVEAFQAANGLEVTGIVDEETLEALEKATGLTGKLTNNVYKYIKSIDELGGRQLIINSLKNAYTGLKNILGSVKKAWTNVFPKATSKQLYDALVKVNKFSESLILNDKHLGKIQNAFEGFFNVLRVVKDVFVEIASAGVKLAWNVFKPLGKIALTCASSLGKFFTKITSGSDTVLKPFSAALDVVVDAISKFANAIGDNFDSIVSVVSKGFGKWRDAMAETELFKKISGYIQDGSEAMSEALGKLQDYINNLDLGTITEKAQDVGDFFISIGQAIGNNKYVIAFVDTIVETFGKLIDFFSNLDFKMPTFNLDSFANFITGGFGKFVQYLNENNFTGIGGTIKGFFKWIGSLFGKKVTTFKNNALTSITDFFVTSGDMIQKGFEKAKEVFASIKEFMFGTEDVKLSDILAVANKVLGIVLLIQSIKMVTAFGGIAKNITDSFENMTDGFKNITASLKWQAIAGAFKGLAIALGTFAICLLIIYKMDVKSALTSAGILIALLAVMGIVVGVLMKLASKLGDEIKMASVAGSLLAFSAAIGILVWVLKTIDGTDFKNLGRSLSVMVGVMAALAISVGILGKLCGGTAIKAAGAIITMLMAAKMIPEVLKQYAEYPWNTVKSGIPAMVAVLGGLALVCRAITVAGKDGASVKGTALLLIALVVSLKLLLSTIEDFGNMNTQVMWQGIKGVTAVLAGITAMFVAINLSSSLKSAERTSATFAGLATALLGTAATIYILGKMDVNALKQGGIATGLILTMFTGMLVAIGKTGGGNPLKGVIPMLILMGAIIGEMYFIVRGLAKIGWEKALGSAGALGLLLIAMTGVMRTLNDCKDVKAKTIAKWAGILVVFSGVLAILGGILVKMEGLDPATAIARAGALSALLATMVGCFAALGGIAKFTNGLDVGGTLGLFAGFGIIVAAIAAIISAMRGVNPTKAIGQVAALSALLTVMIGCFAALGLIAKFTNSVDLAGTLVLFAGFAVIVAGVALILKELQALNINGKEALGQVAALSVLLLAMVGCFAVLGLVSNTTKVGDLGGTLVMFAAFGLIVAAVALVLKELQALNINGGEALGQVTALSVLLLAMSSCMLILGVVGRIGGTALIPALAALGVFALGLTAFLGVLGIIEQISNGGFSTIMDNAIVIMQKMGEAIGAFFGGIAGGVMTAISSTLPQLGSDLSSFMNNAQGFFDGLNNIDFAMVGKAALLAPIIGALEALAAINGIANLFSLGRSLPNLGEDLGNFFIQGKPFFDGLQSLNESTVSAAKMLAETIMILGAAELIDGISGMLGLGDSSFGDFGATLTAFGDGMMAFSDSISELDAGDITQITMAASAGKALAEMAKVIPNEGGWAGKIMGENDMAAFGKKLESFGESLLAYGETVSGLTKAHADAITLSAEAGTALASLAGKIPNEGGWAATIMGENDMATFGKRIVAFGASLMEYSEIVSGLTDDDADSIEASATAGTALANLAGSIPNEGGWAATIMGENDMADFGKRIVAFGKSLVQYASIVSALDDSDAQAITTSKGCAEALVSVADVIPKTDGGWWGAIAGETDLEAFGTGMSSIAKAIKDFSTVAAALGEDDITAINFSKEVIKAMDSAASEVSNSGGLGEMITGSKDYSGFASGMISLANGVKRTVEASSDLSMESIGKIALLQLAITSLASAAKSLPNEGGLVGMIAGNNNDYIGFATGMMAIAASVKQCITITGGITAEGVASIGFLTLAIEALAAAAKSLPNEGGLVSMIAGDNNDYVGFGNGMTTLASSIKRCITITGGITAEGIASIGFLKLAIEALADAAKSLPNDGGLVSMITGDNNDYAGFGSGMATLATQIKQAVMAARGISEDDVAEGGAIGRLKLAIAGLSSAAKALPNEGGLAGMLAGSNTDSGTFGASMVSLATQIRSCISVARGITTEDVGEGGTIHRLRYAIMQLSSISTSGFSTNTEAMTLAIYNIRELAGVIAGMSAIDSSATDGFVEAVNNLGEISIGGLVETVAGGAAQISAAFTGLLDSAVTAINSKQAQMVLAFRRLISTSVATINSSRPQFMVGGTMLISTLIQGIQSRVPMMKMPILSGVMSCIAAVQSNVGAMMTAGGYLGDGLIQGINSKVEAAYQAGYALGQAAVQGEKDGQNSHSPSKETIQAGHWLGEGLVIGIKDMGKKVYSAGKSMGENATSSISGALDTALGLLNGDMDSQPTIRPVLDLSEVQAGAGTINGMLNLQPSMAIQANVGAITTAMNQRNQNGANADVVSAINKLRGDLGNVQGNTYTVNGVTYDDGSNISDAVGALVRAARVERRI